MRLAVPVVFVWVSALSAQGDEARPSLRDVEIEGVRTFTAEQIRDALAGEAATWEALLAGSDEAATQLGARVREGYLAAGFLEAAVHGTADGRRVRLTVDEGPRRLCGPVRLEGTDDLAAGDLAAALAEPGTGDDARWREGAPAPGDATSRRRLWRRVVAAFAAQGRTGIVGTVSLVPTDQVAELHVRIDDEGDPVRMGKVELRGERPGDREAVLARLDLREGELCTAALLARTRAQLDGLARYVRVRIPELSDAVDGRIDPFVIRVELADYAPALSSAPHPDEAQVNRALEWLRDHLDRGGAIRMDFDVDAPVRFGPLGSHMGAGTASVEMGKAGVVLRADRLSLFGEDARPLEIVFTPREIACMDDGRVCVRIPLPATMSPSLTAYTHADSDTGFSGGWKFAWDARAQPGGLFLRLDPLTASYLVHGKKAFTRDGGELVVRQDDGSVALRIAEDGTPSLGAVFANERVSFTTATATERLAALDGRIARGEMHEVSVPALLAGRLRALAVSTDAPAPDGAMARLAAAVVQHAFPTGAAEPEGARERFRLPPQGQAAPFRAVVHAVCDRLGIDRFESWPGTVLDSLPELFEPRTRPDALRRLVRLETDAASGPLALACTSEIFRRLGLEEIAQRHLAAAVARCDFEHAWSDLTCLSPRGSHVDTWLRGIGRRWREDVPDLVRGAKDAAGGDADLAALRAGLRALWDGGLGERIRRALEEAAAGK